MSLRTPILLGVSFVFFLFGSSCKTMHVKRDRANAQIKDLKNGYLLVRLQTKTGTIAQLKKMEKAKQAKRLEEKVTEGQEKIIKAFAEHFTFCPVYFFSSENGRAVKRGEKEMIFGADAEQPISAKALENKDYLVAEFVEEFSNNAYASINVMHYDYELVEPPFPSIITKPSDAPVAFGKYTYRGFVKALDSKLHRFYDKAMAKAERKAAKSKNKN